MTPVLTSDCEKNPLRHPPQRAIFKPSPPRSFGKELLAIDGTKIRAQSSKKNNISEGKIQKRLDFLDELIAPDNLLSVVDAFVAAARDFQPCSRAPWRVIGPA